MAKLTLSIGSNLGNREENLSRARAGLAAGLGDVVYTSPVRETPPWGLADQPSFLNQIVVVETLLPLIGPQIRESLHHILSFTQELEAKLGRERKTRWGPRTIDIDLIFAGDVLYEDDRISLPHPWWHARSFVTDLLPTDPRFAPRYFR